MAARSLDETSLLDTELGFGGPETYTQADIVELAFHALGKRPRIVHVSPALVDAAASIIRPFNRNASGFVRFFRAVATTDMVGTAVGSHSLAAFYRSLAAESAALGAMPRA